MKILKEIVPFQVEIFDRHELRELLIFMSGI